MCDVPSRGGKNENPTFPDLQPQKKTKGKWLIDLSACIKWNLFSQLETQRSPLSSRGKNMYCCESRKRRKHFFSAFIFQTVNAIIPHFPVQCRGSAPLSVLFPLSLCASAFAINLVCCVFHLRCDRRIVPTRRLSPPPRCATCCLGLFTLHI